MWSKVKMRPPTAVIIIHRYAPGLSPDLAAANANIMVRPLAIMMSVIIPTLVTLWKGRGHSGAGLRRKAWTATQAANVLTPACRRAESDCGGLRCRDFRCPASEGS